MRKISRRIRAAYFFDGNMTVNRNRMMDSPWAWPLLFAILNVCGWALPNSAHGNEIAKPDRVTVLHLINGDHVTGTLLPGQNQECIGWQSPSFESPFQFPFGGLASIHLSAPTVLPQAEGAYSFELAGGDLLFGSLVGLDDETATVEVTGGTRLVIERNSLLRIYRRQGGNEVIFVGPSGLVGWQTDGKVADAWVEDAGHLLTDKQDVKIRRDFNMPNLARIEFELSWMSQPDFELAVAVDGNSKTISRAYRFDVWEGELVIQRETEKEANVESLMKLEGKSGRIHVQAFINQEEGRMLVYSSAGESLADLKVSTSKPQVYGGIQLHNRRGDVRLERLQIGKWNGEPPRRVELDKTRIHDVDGTIVYGNLKSFDPVKHEFTVSEDGGSRTISEDRVQDIFLAQPPRIEQRVFRAVYLTGMKLSGDLDRIEGRKLWLKSPGIRGAVEISLDDLQSLLVLAPKSDPPELPQKRGRLEVAGVSLHGCLIDSLDSSSSCLVWQPIRSLTASPLQKGISARIVYRDPPKPVAARVQPQNQPVPGAIPERIVKKLPARNSKPKTDPAQSILHLRTGDTMPCEVVGVDEKGLMFKSTSTTSTFVPHEQIHAVEFMPTIRAVEIDVKKQERLLTLPRMQRDNPPTQLFRDVDGDYLRGRLVGINDAQIQVELRLEGKFIRRDRVARIIWLHPEQLAKTDKEKEQADGFAANLIQTIETTGESRNNVSRNRLTFAPARVEGAMLSGQSEFFGECKKDLAYVDELLIGGAIERVSAELPFGKWKLKNALEPLAPKEEGGDNSGEGQESSLVGKIAPDISLKTLDGKQFVLKDHRQKVVILDFWASWCGPCMQVMPQIDKVAAEFADQGVELYAVNLEETPDKVKAALERLKLSPTVVMDRDGRIAEKYGATSIPQTVIIDREGKVARLYVGGGARFDEQLRTALKAVLSGEEPKQPE